MPLRDRRQEQKQQQLLTLLAGLFDVLDAERSSVIAGLDRFGARQKELAAGIREDNDEAAHLQADTAADAGAGQPDGATRDLGGRGVPGPAPVVELCLRRAGQDRAAAVRAGAHDPAEPAMKSARFANSSAACGRSTGVRGSNGRPAPTQPSVPSGYQATCV